MLERKRGHSVQLPAAAELPTRPSIGALAPLFQLGHVCCAVAILNNRGWLFVALKFQKFRKLTKIHKRETRAKANDSPRLAVEKKALNNILRLSLEVYCTMYSGI